MTQVYLNDNKIFNLRKIFFLWTIPAHPCSTMNKSIQSSHAPNAKPRAVLTAEDAVQIFRRSPRCDRLSSATATTLGREYGVSEKAVRDIWTARTWADETRHLDPQRPPRESKHPGRPLGKRDGVPRRRKHGDPEDATKMKSREPRKPSPSSHGSLKQIARNFDGVCLAQQNSVQPFFGCSVIGSSIQQDGLEHHCIGVDAGRQFDCKPITTTASSSPKRKSSLSSNVPASVVSDFTSSIAMGGCRRAWMITDVAEQAQIERSSVPECQTVKVAAIQVGKGVGGSWGPLIPTSWHPEKRKCGPTQSTTEPYKIMHFPSMIGNLKNGSSYRERGCRSRSDLGESVVADQGCSFAWLGGPSGRSKIGGSNSDQSISVVGFLGNGEFFEERRCGAENTNRTAMQAGCASRTGQTDAGSKHSMRFQPPAFRGQYAPNNGCDLTQSMMSGPERERWACAPQATQATARNGHGWAADKDLSLGWPGDSASATVQDLATARASPVATISFRVSAARIVGADSAGSDLDPLQRRLWSATPRGGAQSTWQLEPEHWTPVFDPPPKRSTTEGARCLQPMQQQQGKQRELHYELQHQQHLYQEQQQQQQAQEEEEEEENEQQQPQQQCHKKQQQQQQQQCREQHQLHQPQQYVMRLEQHPSVYCQHLQQQPGQMYNLLLPRYEQVQERHGCPSHGREQRHEDSSWRRMGGRCQAGLP